MNSILNYKLVSESDSSPTEKVREKTSIRVLIADDHASIRNLLAFSLKLEPRITVIGETNSGLKALTLITTLKPDLLILDLTLMELNGVEVLRQIRKFNFDIRVLIYSGSVNVTLILECLKFEPDGYVDKTEEFEVFKEGLNAVLSGERFFSTLPKSLLGKLNQKNMGLTRREMEVMQLVVEGKYTKEIGECLNISPKTVEIHRTKLMIKVNARNAADLTRYAMRNGLVQ